MEIKFFNLPFEELIFFTLIPQSCLLLWVAFNRFHTFKELKEVAIWHAKKFKLM